MGWQGRVTEKLQMDRAALEQYVAELVAECKSLSGALDAAVKDYNRMKQSYELKVEDFARETLARSSAEQRLRELAAFVESYWGEVITPAGCPCESGGQRCLLHSVGAKGE